MNPKVSVVVAVYNAEKSLSRCIDSLLAQTFNQFEVICVNDASTDNSQQIIDEYCKKDSRVRSIVHANNMNAGGAMNDGIKAAKGAYICLVDNDDWLDTRALELLIKESEEGVYDIVLTGLVQTFKNGDRRNIQNIPSNLNHDEMVEYGLIHGAPLLGSLIRKDLYINNNLFYPERRFYEDNPVHFTLLTCAHRIKSTGYFLYYYYQSEGSVTRSTNITKIQDRIYTNELFLHNVKRVGTYDKYEEYILISYVQLVCQTIRLLSRVSLQESLPLLDSEICKFSVITKKQIKQMQKKYINSVKFPRLSFVKNYISYHILRGVSCIRKH